MNYFERKEQEDTSFLRNFNEKTNLFKTIVELPRLSHADASGYTRDGRTYLLEQKDRTNPNKPFSRYKDVAIEPLKIDYLNSMNFDVKLYVNYDNSDDTVYIWVIDERTKETSRFDPEFEIYDKGKQRYCIVPRYFLDKDKAIIYHKKNDRYERIK